MIPTITRLPSSRPHSLRFAVATFLTLCLWLPQAHAQTIINSPSQHSAGAVLQDFESYPLHTTGPLTTGLMTISGFNFNVAPDVEPQNGLGFTIVQNPGVFTGQWFGPYQNTGQLSDFRFTFSSAVAEFGLGILDANFNGNALRAYNAQGDLIAEVLSAQGSSNFPTFPTGGGQPGQSAYTGFVFATNQISRVELTSVRTPSPDFLGIDNVRYVVAAAAPEPCSLSLLGIGLATGVGMVNTVKRRKTKQAA